MSIEALRWALDVGEEKNLDPTQRHILLILGNIADQQGYLYPSVAYIARVTGQSRRTVQRHCKAMVAAELLARRPRANDAGERTSDSWQLAMRQPGLPLGGQPVDNPRRGGDKLTPPRANVTPPPRHGDTPGGVTLTPNTKSYTQEDTTASGRGHAPTPVARGFKAYADGIKRRYGTDYPPSKRANGMLANVVARVGGEHIEAVVGAYIGSSDPWYGKVRHKLDFLVRDCEQLLMSAQRQAGGGAPVTKVRVRLVKADDEVARDLGDFPVGDPLSVARDVRGKYARMIDGMRANKVDVKYIDVLAGGARNRYAIAELTT